MHGKKLSLWIAATFTTACLNMATASTLTIPVKLVSKDGTSEDIGTIIAEDSPSGLLWTPKLQHLPPGTHGFHVHETPSCDKQGMAAGGHLDPKHTKQHDGPYNNHGHLGDLPVLVVNQDGTATLPTLAPRLTVKEIMGHSIIIHAGSDNYSDSPQKLGGGGARIACGVIAKS